MPPAIAIGAAFAGAAATVASVAVAVVSTVAAVIGPVVAAVGSVVGSIVATLGPVLSSIVNTVGGIVEGISGAIQGAVEIIRTRIAEPFAGIVESLKTGIGELAKAITEPVKPILDPIKETLTTIHDFVADTHEWIKVQLEPIEDLVDLVNTISAINVIKGLLTGTTSISQVIGDVAEESGLKTAEAITILWRDTVQMGTGILEEMRNQYTIVNDVISDTDERLRKDMKVAIEYTEETFKGQVEKVEHALRDRIGPMERELAYIERRTTDLPFFQEMLIRAIE